LGDEVVVHLGDYEVEDQERKTGPLHVSKISKENVGHDEREKVENSHDATGNQALLDFFDEGVTPRYGSSESGSLIRRLRVIELESALRGASQRPHSLWKDILLGVNLDKSRSPKGKQRDPNCE
jgi:hypothetical protein